MVGIDPDVRVKPPEGLRRGHGLRGALLRPNEQYLSVQVTILNVVKIHKDKTADTDHGHPYQEKLEAKIQSLDKMEQKGLCVTGINADQPLDQALLHIKTALWDLL